MPEFFPLWVVVTHFLNILFLLLLARSGIEVLSSLPKLYWSDHCHPGREWLRFSRRVFSADSRRLWSSLEEEESWSPVVALPGRKNLGLGRHWHFMTVPFWILTGLVYVAMIFATGYWRYLVPTDWAIVPDALHALGEYLQLHTPAAIPGEPFEPAQKLAYFLVIFVLAPFQIATGAAMSPSVLARFPRYGRLFGGKQGARSLHFLGLVAFAGFTLVHTILVIVHGLPSELAKITLGDADGDRGLAIGLAVAGLAAILAVQVLATRASLEHPRRVQRALGALVDPLQRAITHTFTSRQRFSPRDVSPYHRVNGFPPPDEGYERLAAGGFADYRLRVGGLVEHPLELSLSDLRALGVGGQITRHNCIQGWTAVAQWAGVPLARVLDLAVPRTGARYVVFYALDDKGLTEGEGRHGHFYGTLPLELAGDPQTILALEMNGGPLPIQHGAPLRLRVETQLGFKMVKWISAIELVDDYRSIGMGQGGWREDQMYYSNAAGI